MCVSFIEHTRRELHPDDDPRASFLSLSYQTCRVLRERQRELRRPWFNRFSRSDWCALMPYTRKGDRYRKKNSQQITDARSDMKMNRILRKSKWLMIEKKVKFILYFYLVAGKIRMIADCKLYHELAKASMHFEYIIFERLCETALSCSGTIINPYPSAINPIKRRRVFSSLFFQTCI